MRKNQQASSARVILKGERFPSGQSVNSVPASLPSPAGSASRFHASKAHDGTGQDRQEKRQRHAGRRRAAPQPPGEQQGCAQNGAEQGGRKILLHFEPRQR